MHDINFFITEKDDSITIGVEQVYYPTKPNVSKYDDYFFERKNILELTTEASRESEGFIQKQLNRNVAVTSARYNLKINAEEKAEIQNSLTYYTIPTDPALQIIFLNALGTFTVSKLFDAVYVSDGPLLNEQSTVDFDSFQKMIAAKKPMSSAKLDFFESLAKTISESKLSDKVKSTCSYVIYYYFAQTHAVPFSECLLAKNRFLINYWDKLPQAIQDKKFTTPLKDILEQAKKNLSSKEYDYLLEEIADDARKALFFPCIGEKAHDGGWYKLSYTEFKFIKNIDLRLENEQLVVNLDSNKGYKEDYAPGKRNHGIFKEEMLALAKHNGWEFEDTDFHQRMAFTKEYTQKLLESGIFIQPSQSSLLASITHTLFGNVNTNSTQCTEEIHSLGL